MSRMRKAKKTWKAEEGVDLTSVCLQMETWKYLNLRRRKKRKKNLFLNVKTDLSERCQDLMLLKALCFLFCHYLLIAC